jgi:dihydrofolate reductase
MATPGQDIGVHGSISLTQSLITMGLVDEIHLIITPTIAGKGTRLFPAVPDAR